MELKRNLPDHPDWEGSFYGQLTEHGRWNNPAFDRLLQCLSELRIVDPIRSETARDLLSLQAKVLNLVAAHFNQQDVFIIENLDTEEILDKSGELESAIMNSIKS